jgi:hypothetical protein
MLDNSRSLIRRTQGFAALGGAEGAGRFPDALAEYAAEVVWIPEADRGGHLPNWQISGGEKLTGSRHSHLLQEIHD